MTSFHNKWKVVHCAGVEQLLLYLDTDVAGPPDEFTRLVVVAGWMPRRARCRRCTGIDVVEAEAERAADQAHAVFSCLLV
jgi:hypothetical protein